MAMKIEVVLTDDGKIAVGVSATTQRESEDPQRVTDVLLAAIGVVRHPPEQPKVLPVGAGALRSLPKINGKE